MRMMLVLVAVVGACGDRDSVDLPDASIPADAQSAVDFNTHIGIGQQWCKINDRAAFGLSSDSPEAAIQSGVEWCTHDANCDGVCAAYLDENPPGPPVAEFFVACDPQTATVVHRSCG